MPLKYPDIFEPNNQSNAQIDSDFVRGGGRVTANLSTLLTDFATKTDQLKDNVTLVWVVSAGQFYRLKSKASIGNLSNGWEPLGANITVDSTPANGSSNPIASNWAYSAEQSLNAKLAGTLTSDAEAQITSAPGAEDNKFVSRLKLFNWWSWVKGQAQSIAGIWSFTDTTDSTSTTTGAVKITGGLGVGKNITAKSANFTDNAGTGYRVAVFNPTGGLETPYNVILPYVEDSTIITQLTTEANWDAANTYTGTTIVGGNQGQYHNTASWWYYFVDDLTPVRLSKGKVVHLIGSSGAPTIVAGSGAGTTPTGVSVTGTDLGGKVIITTGTSPSASAPVVTITFNRPYGTAPSSVILTPANAAANALTGGAKVYIADTGVSTTTFQLTSGTTGLTAGTQYKWFYLAVQ